MNFFKSVGNAVGNAANNVKKGAENVGKGVVHGAKTVGKVYCDVSKEVSKKTGEGIKNLGEGIGKSTGLVKKTVVAEEYLDKDIPYDDKRPALSLCSCIEDDERNAMWCMEYFMKWESFPVKMMNDAYNNAFEKLKKEVDDMLDDPNNIKDDKKKMIIKGTVGKVSSEVMKSTLKKVIAAEVVKCSIGGAVKNGGRRAAIVVVTKSLTQLASSGALQALTNPAVGIASMAGEMCA